MYGQLEKNEKHVIQWTRFNQSNAVGSDLFSLLSLSEDNLSR